MKIVIATGIYPPEIGGPAKYAKNLASVWLKDGHEVSIKVFSRFNKFPTGVRHILYFLSIIPAIASADYILILDNFSCALPTVVASLIFNKKTVLRTGGDFLWEQYVERTGDLVLLREFYKTRINRFSSKERTIFKMIGFVLRKVKAIIWSTQWQREIFKEPYHLSKEKNFVVENYYGPKVADFVPESKNFIASSRQNKLKNLQLLKTVFSDEDIINKGGILDTKPESYAKFFEKIRKSYAVIVASISDISPNLILDAIRCSKPFIVTKETGLYGRIKDVALFVDPKDKEDISQKVLWLCDEKNYDDQKKKIESFNFTHSWEDIAKEIIGIFKDL